MAAGVFCIRSTLSSCHPLDSIEDTLLDCAADFLPRAPESTAAQTYKNIIEIIVAAANPETAAAAGDALVVHNPAGTTPSGLNLAINASSGNVIVRCDAHSVLPAPYVAQAVETFQRTSSDNVSGMQVPIGISFWQRAIGAAIASPIGADGARYRIGGARWPSETSVLGHLSARHARATWQIRQEILEHTGL